MKKKTNSQFDHLIQIECISKIKSKKTTRLIKESVKVASFSMLKYSWDLKKKEKRG